MLATFVQNGDRVDYTPSSAVDAGDVLVIGSTVAVATEAIAADALGSVAISGVVRFPKATGSGAEIAGGTKVYWDASGEVVTTTASTHKCAGYTVPDGAGDDDATVDVVLSRA